jgi:hypothetical protein
MKVDQRFSPLSSIASAMHMKRDLLLSKLPEPAIVASQQPRIRGMLVFGADRLII